jgi:ribosomal protein S18 acetylase RimI-like enzyme
MQIRRLESTDDMARAGRLVQQAYVALDGYPHDPDYHAMLGDVASRAAEADVVVAVNADGQIVGCLTFVPGHDNVHAEFDDVDAASFRYFGVDPSTQGAGVGEAMVRWVLAEAGRLGRRRIRIHTLVAMTGAQRLYQRLGFVREPSLDEDWDGIIGLAYVFHLSEDGGPNR